MISITLTPEQEKFIQNKLKSGKYNNPQEVINEAFKLLEKEEERVESLWIGAVIYQFLLMANRKGWIFYKYMKEVNN